MSHRRKALSNSAYNLSVPSKMESLAPREDTVWTSCRQAHFQPLSPHHWIDFRHSSERRIGSEKESLTVIYLQPRKSGTARKLRGELFARSGAIRCMPFGQAESRFWMWTSTKGHAARSIALVLRLVCDQGDSSHESYSKPLDCAA